MNSSQKLIPGWLNQDQLAEQTNPRIAEKFSFRDYENDEPPGPNDHARNQIIRTLRNLQQDLLHAELDKQEATRQLGNAEDRIKHLNITYDEMKAILESLE